MRLMFCRALAMLCSMWLSVAARAGSVVSIHNGLVTAPNGIAFVIDDRAAFVIDVKPELPKGTKGPAYVPGMTAPDDSIHHTDFATDVGTLHLAWGRVGDAVVARCTADRPMHVVLSLLPNTWPGFVTQYTASEDGVTAEAKQADGQTISWRLHATPAPLSSDGKTIVLDVAPDHPARFTAGIGILPADDQIDPDLTAAEQAYLRHRPVATGGWGDFLGAISDNLNNSRVYSSDNHLLAHTVTRGWAHGVNGDVYFCWDSFFNGLLACLDDPQCARNTIRAILSCQTEDGRVPNFGHWNLRGRTTSNDRSQPPVGAMCVWKMNQHWPDDAFLREVYPKLVRWHEWWPRARDGRHDGLLEWGSDGAEAAGWQGARWETGWDDTPAFEGGKMVGSTMNVYAVDLNALWSADAEYLALIADSIGQPADAARFRSEHIAMNQRINDKLWNPDLGVYCHRLWDQDGKPGAFLTRLSPMNFYPLICGAPDAQQARQVLSILSDPKKFWGKWLVPTLAYDDPDWAKQNYWRGKVWAPVNYLVFQGLKRYGSPQLQAEMADKSVKIFQQNWTAHGVCGENFLSTTGEQSSSSHYTWGALMCLIGLESIVDQTPDGKIVTGQNAPAGLNLRHIPLNGKRYQITMHEGRVQLAEEH